jgi:hypothetical protein
VHVDRNDVDHFHAFQYLQGSGYLDDQFVDSALD